MSGLQFSFSKSLVATTALAFISASCLSSVAFAMEPDEDKARGVSAAPSHKGSTDADPHADNSTSNSNNPALWDALFQRNLYSSISLTSLQLKSPSGYYELAHVLQEVLLPSALRLGDDFKMPKEIAWWVQWENMISQTFPENSPQGNYLLGFVYESFGLNQDAFDAYKKAADAGSIKAQSKVSTALYFGELGQDTRPKQERLNEIQARAAAGDQSAQMWENQALYFGKLGQRKRPKQERFNELKLLAVMGDQNARKWMNEALCWGLLGQGRRPEQERLQELEMRAAGGDQDAQVQVDDVLFHDNTLDQGRRTEQERFQELEMRADGGDQKAQELVSLALSDGRVGQGRHSPQERFKKLLACAAKGYSIAQDLVNGALYSGALGQDTRPEEERFAELQARAAGGDQNAQKWVNMALYFGALDQDTRPEQERVKELISHVKNDITYTYIDGMPKILETFIFPLLESLREGK